MYVPTSTHEKRERVDWLLHARRSGLTTTSTHSGEKALSMCVVQNERAPVVAMRYNVGGNGMRRTLCLRLHVRRQGCVSNLLRRDVDDMGVVHELHNQKDNRTYVVVIRDTSLSLHSFTA